MSNGRLIELVAAVLILGAAVWLYRRNKAADQGYGNQGAVVLLVVAVIMGIHALGWLNYHPSRAEADYFRAKAQ